MAADHAQKGGDAYVYVESEVEGTNRFAYSCSTINTAIATLHEFTLRLVLSDSIRKTYLRLTTIFGISV